MSRYARVVTLFQELIAQLLSFAPAHQFTLSTTLLLLESIFCSMHHIRLNVEAVDKNMECAQSGHLEGMTDHLQSLEQRVSRMENSLLCGVPAACTHVHAPSGAEQAEFRQVC